MQTRSRSGLHRVIIGTSTGDEDLKRKWADSPHCPRAAAPHRTGPTTEHTEHTERRTDSSVVSHKFQPRGQHIAEQIGKLRRFFPVPKEVFVGLVSFVVEPPPWSFIGLSFIFGSPLSPLSPFSFRSLVYRPGRAFNLSQVGTLGVAFATGTREGRTDPWEYLPGGTC